MPEQTSPSDRSAETRTRILEAALGEFAGHGLAGARTERIATAAGVNKALLYYYFDSKEKLYIAALEFSAERIRDTSMAVFLSSGTAGERIVRTALNHFDRIIGQQEFQSMMQQEMIRLHKGESDAMSIIIKRVFAPMMSMYQALVREGIASGELIDVDWMQMHLSTLGANVFYFLSSPLWRKITSVDPLDPDVLKARREQVVKFLGQAIFIDRRHGSETAQRVLAESPMPEITGSWPFMGRKA
jgi:TetR/AcrR family transcriptional regulator